MDKKALSTFKEWLLHQFTEDELSDICNHGAQNSFGGLIYYTETTALYDRYCNDIWDMLYEDCNQFGLTSCLELISSFNGAKEVNTEEQFKNLLVWYATERVVFEITQAHLDEKEDLEIYPEDIL